MLTPIPSVGAGVEGPSVSNIGNKIIVACGFDPGVGDNATTRIYDISTDTWSFGTDAPGTNSEGTGVSHGGYFYVVGGRGPGFSANWRYDIITDSWVALAPLPTGRTGLATAVVGNSIYAMGGRTLGGPNAGIKNAVVEKYDISSNTWSAVSSMPAARSDHAAAAHGGKIYVFGGFNAAGALMNTVWVYDPVTDTWTIGLAPMPTPRAAMYAVGTSGNTIYVIGGWDGIFPFNAVVGSTVEAYKISKDSWTTGYSPMPTARAEMGAASHGGQIYLVGGATPGFGASVASNQAYKP